MDLKKIARQKSALARLEKQYEAFKAAGKDKAPHDSTRNGKTIHHPGRTYAEECHRLSEEISIEKIHSEFSEMSFASKLMESLMSNPLELQMAYELMKDCKD